MSDRISLLQRVSTLDKAPQFDSYSKVIINIDEETQVSAGNDFGRTLEFDNPFGTQAMANQILAKLRGFQYQPYSSSGALLDPAAEIGDAVSIKNVYGGLYTRVRTFSRLMKADISAPYDEEINHEYKFESPEQRKFKREMGDVRATLSIESDRITAEVAQRQADSAEFRSQLSVQATQIAARVTQTGGSQSSFGWSLLSNEFGLYAGNTKVFWVNSTGAHVKGEITATSGKIGNFNIGSTAIWNNISQYGGTQTTGVYLGTDGIQLGQNFRVNTSGQITASGGTIGGFTITNNAIYNKKPSFWDNVGEGVFIGADDGFACGNNFKADKWGNVTAKSLVLSGGSINLGDGMFQVSSVGEVTASNLVINGGRISIGGNFTVDQNGNVTANSGTFRGNVSAGNIQYGGNYGTFNAGGLTDGTIGYTKYGQYSITSGAISGQAIINRTIGDNAVSYGKVDFQSTLSQVGTNASNISSLQGDMASKRSISNCNFDNLYLLKEGYYHSLYADYITIGGTQRKMVFWN